MAGYQRIDILPSYVAASFRCFLYLFLRTKQISDASTLRRMMCLCYDYEEKRFECTSYDEYGVVHSPKPKKEKKIK